MRAPSPATAGVVGGGRIGPRKTSDRRAAQNREAQLRHKAKVQNRIKELEAEVSCLQNENAQLRNLATAAGLDLSSIAVQRPAALPQPALVDLSASNQTVSTPVIRLAQPPQVVARSSLASNSTSNICLQDLPILPDLMQYFNTNPPTGVTVDLSALLLSPEHGAPFSTHSSPDVTTSSSDWLDLSNLSAVDQLGQPQVLSTRFALKSLPSLQENSDVDAMLNNFILQAEQTDPKKIKKYLIQILKSRHKVLDACTPEDRVRALEILEICKITNLPHVTHLYESGLFGKDSSSAMTDAFMPADSSTAHTSTQYNGMASIAVLNLNLDIASFRAAVKVSVPSLLYSDAAVDELCHLFKQQATCVDKDEREVAFFKSQELGQRLLNLCHVEDRTRFAGLMNQWREHNKSVDKVLNEAE
ncbi:hypothetical protein BC830DRAFT_1096828 [Chytriomyces sp. MP71]|nr:hypothetical protein BC830DRAFT_1096828 [Chytriomyces sp. MP71]